MNSDISAVQRGKAPELILLSMCHILLEDFFFRPLFPQEWRQLNACGCSRSVTVMLSTALAEDLLQSNHSSHAECSGFISATGIMHSLFNENCILTCITANERADDHLIGEIKNQTKNPTLSGHKTTACRCTTSNQRTPEVLCLLSHRT